MGIFSRLGGIINNYMNDFTGQTANKFGGSSSRSYSGDPDLDAAYEELDDYLRSEHRREKTGSYSWREASSQDRSKHPPEELRADFECLGVSFGADEETCKAAYKKLLKIHHPDRHAGHEGNFKKATERSAKINAAWDRIEKWRQIR